MTLALILGLVSLGGAIALLTVALASRAPATPGAPATSVPAAPTASVKSTLGSHAAGELPPLMARLRSFAARVAPSGYSQKLQHRLDLAGNPKAWPAARVLAVKGAGLIVGTLLGLLLGAHGGITLLLWPVLGAAVGFFLPDLLIRNVGEKRQIELQKKLPDAIDMMTICVEAGLGFDAALARVARNLEGPVAAEFARVLQEMQFGKSRTDALRALVERTNVPELRTFVSSLIQATEFGISIANVLREQAHEMRVRRRQRAEEKAQKLPVKILPPLIVCLLPAMFVVILGPAIINIIHTLNALNH